MYKDFNEKIFEILLIISVYVGIATVIHIDLDLSLDIEDVKGVVTNSKQVNVEDGI